MRQKHWMLSAACVLLAAVLSGCASNPSEEELFAKLIGHFTQRGYTCELTPLAEEDPHRDVPIYNASVWHRLMVDGEEVLVYFDESNRADYLSAPIDEGLYGQVERFGLRFVVVYQGDDAGVLNALAAMPD